MPRFTRPGVVDLLADAYRHRGTAVADRILANRHRDALPAECEAALARVRTEAEADLVVATARATRAADPTTARLEALLELDEEELEQLRRAGFLDGVVDDRP